MTLSFETERLGFRPTTDEDRQALFDLEQDPEVMRYLNGGAPTPLDGVDHEADYLMPRGAEKGLWFASEKHATEKHATGKSTTGKSATGKSTTGKSPGAFVGWYALMPLLTSNGNDDGTAELGYRLRRDMWGRGFATEGAQALIDLGFSQLGYSRIVAGTMAVNRRSRSVMEKSGLVHVRTTFYAGPDALPGAELGDVEYEITRTAWASGWQA